MSTQRKSEKQNQRRQFLKTSAIAAGGALYGGFISSAAAQEHEREMPGMEPMPKTKHESQMPKPIGDPNADRPSSDREKYDGYSRYQPGRGNDPDSDYYLGKLMPGFRSADAGPTPFEAPDLEKLPWKMVNGAKEFLLVPMAVQREFLPGYKINVAAPKMMMDHSS